MTESMRWLLDSLHDTRMARYRLASTFLGYPLLVSHVLASENLERVCVNI